MGSAISATGRIKGDCKGSLDVQDNILQKDSRRLWTPSGTGLGV